MSDAEDMARAPAPTNATIADSIAALADFAAALADYQRRSEQRALFSTPPLRDSEDAARVRFEQDRYLLRPCGGGFRPIETMETAADLLSVLHSHLTNHEHEVAAIEAAITEGALDITALLTLTYCNQGNELRALLHGQGLDEAVATFFALYLARLWRARAARLLTEGLDLSMWSCGYCPVCGHWASLGHLSSEGGKRTLWCLHCTTTWTFPRVRCPFCLNSDHATLDILQPEGDLAHRVQACLVCRRYIKEFRSDSVPDTQGFDAVYLGTPMLDSAAEGEGYLRESNLTVRYENPDGNELLMYRQRPLRRDGRQSLEDADTDTRMQHISSPTITASEE